MSALYGVFDSKTASGPYGPILYNAGTGVGTNDGRSYPGKQAQAKAIPGQKISAQVTHFQTPVIDKWASVCGKKQNRGKDAIGFRKLLKTHYVLAENETDNSKGKKFEKLELENAVTFKTYEQHFDEVRRVAATLSAKTKILSSPAKRVVIYSETNPDWLVAALACFSQNIPIVTIYANLGPEAAAHALKQTKPDLAFVDMKLAKVLVNQILLPGGDNGKDSKASNNHNLSEFSFLKNIVVIGQQQEEEQKKDLLSGLEAVLTKHDKVKNAGCLSENEKMNDTNDHEKANPAATPIPPRAANEEQPVVQLHFAEDFGFAAAARTPVVGSESSSSPSTSPPTGTTGSSGGPTSGSTAPASQQSVGQQSSSSRSTSSHDWIVKAKPEDTAVIMYTSGTTGYPKGVVLSHGNLAALLASTEPIIRSADKLEPGDVYLAYLPLAHVMELVAEVTALTTNLKLIYGSPHTLSDTGVKVKQPESLGDLKVAKPNIMIFAPAVLEKIYSGIHAIFEKRSKFVHSLFLRAVEAGEKRFEASSGPDVVQQQGCNGSGEQRKAPAGSNIKDPNSKFYYRAGTNDKETASSSSSSPPILQTGSSCLYELLLMKKIREKLGIAHLKNVITASAPLSKEQMVFFQTIFNCPVRQGYGATETCGASCMQEWVDNATETVGPPTSQTMIRLKDWEEGNYLNADVYNENIGVPRGEILIGGPLVCQGYFVPEKSTSCTDAAENHSCSGSISGLDETSTSATATTSEDNMKADAALLELDPNAKVIEELTAKNQEDFSTCKDGFRWFHTGDIGCITELGQVKIIDRKKDLWKGPQGEYVALSKVESACKLSPYVENCMCYGKTPGGNFVVLLVVASAAGKEKSAKEIYASVLEHCKKQKLLAFELPKDLRVVQEAWTPENGLLTAKMTMKRVQIAEKERKLIDEMYA
ncbi:unnamed protein product [Amoebophrya sp. A120]|nr:unnamed protein product [Amoebophrya sp. A120]|eukprot:GSA120T00020425001.1